MNRTTHPVEQEELMAYFDGELSTERGAAVAAHLEQCTECQGLSADLRSVSQQLAGWQIEPASPGCAERVAAELREHRKANRDQEELAPHHMRNWVLGLVGVAAALMVIFAISVPNLLKSRQAANQVTYQYSRAARQDQARAGGGGGGSEPAETLEPTGPMIIRTASLTLIAKDFDKVRAEAEAVIQRHHGYSAQLSVTGEGGAGRALTATYRLPADQLDATFNELKQLARVTQESQGGEEVTRRYVDLVARLANARNTEQRLNEVLRQNTGRITDILAVEKEVSRVRGEIETMEAERKNLQNQVQYATLELKLSEEYKAQIEVPAPSTGTQIHNAFVDGLRSLYENALGVLLFFLSYGPPLLFWTAILFFPARFAWRKVRAAAEHR